MKRTIGLGCCVLLALATFSVRASEPAKTEIDGTWELVQFYDKGEDDQETVNSTFLIIRDRGMQTVMKGGELWKKAQYSVNPNASPKEITFRDQKAEESTLIGIYEIDGDKMKVAVLADKGNQATERPKDFNPSENNMVATYRRKK